MSTDARIPAGSDTQRSEAVLRISEAVSACREPEELARILAAELGAFLPFDHLGVTIFKEDSKDIECLAWGKGPVYVPEAPVEELPMWQVYESQETLLINDWKKAT